MATEVKLPRLGQGMESGTIVRWLKAEGDAVKANEPLYELDTDKVTQEVESEVDGVLLKIVVPEGEIEVGTTIAVIGSDSGDVTVESAAAAADDDGRRRLPRRHRARDEHSAPTAASAAGRQRSCARAGRRRIRVPAIKASPLARRIARERGLELSRDRGHRPRRPDPRRGRRARPCRRRARAGPGSAGTTGRRGRGHHAHARPARRSRGDSPRPGRRRCSSSASRST